MESTSDSPWYLKSIRPVLLPQHEALTQCQHDFGNFLAKELQLLSISKTADHDTSPDAGAQYDSTATPNESPFLSALHGHDLLASRWQRQVGKDADNKTLTANGDVTNISTKDNLVDLFHILRDNVNPQSVVRALDLAWEQDPLATLKIIFNARSIHLGKSARKPFYMASGWLAHNHPKTLIGNLSWLCRPVIEKKTCAEPEDDIEIVEIEKPDDDPTRFDVHYGMAHGYWKDLLNILALAVNGKLDPLCDPAELLNVEDAARKLRSTKSAMGRNQTKTLARRSAQKESLEKHQFSEHSQSENETTTTKKELRERRHAVATQAFSSDTLYRCLHLTIARLFAEQLQSDIHALREGNAKEKRLISLCAKWAPSDDHFHERHTFIISSIAEILYPRENIDVVGPADDREKYLRHAREQYRRDVSALRKHLDIVERKLTAKTYNEIDYSKVPSLAMDLHKLTFIQNDTVNFANYLSDVADGKKTVSGATLLPSTIIRQLRENKDAIELTEDAMRKMTANQIMKHKMAEMNGNLLEGQWTTLVERIKQSGTLESSIAVCDVSGSMGSRISSDGTTAMDAAIGLSMLVAETTKAPFTGSFITFSATPEMVKLNLGAPLHQRFRTMSRAKWDMNTNFVSVFLDLILPAAVRNQIAPNDMVKRVFVFSDMQFDSAEGRTNKWQSSYEVIQEAYTNAGYSMPELVFWDLAGHQHQYHVQTSLATAVGGLATVKPVTAADVGTALVSGFSQGMLKVFLDGGSLRETTTEDEESIAMQDEEGDSDAVVVKTGQPSKMTPRSLLEKAIGHLAYRMLAVYD